MLFFHAYHVVCALMLTLVVRASIAVAALKSVADRVDEMAPANLFDFADYGGWGCSDASADVDDDDTARCRWSFVCFAVVVTAVVAAAAAALVVAVAALIAAAAAVAAAA